MWSIILSIAGLLQAAPPATAPTAAPTTAPAGRPEVVLVVGAPGAEEYAPQFTAWADRWSSAARQRSAGLIEIGRDEASASNTDKDKLKAALDAAAKEGTEPLWIVLIGHGTYDGKEAKFNVRGPDFSAAELSDWVKPFQRPLALIDCSSSSAPFLNRVSAKGRIVITATRAGSEIQFARFGDYFSQSITDPTADLDKDGQTSLLEAFLAASHRVEEFYKQESRLATEHALLDDNGDGLGISSTFFDGLRATRSARDGAPLDGPRARQWHLLLSPSEEALSSDVRARRDQLELQLEALRQKKASMPEEAYFAQLEPLLLELAGLYQNGALPATQPAPAMPQ